ncbi:MAG: carboxymuconolactone decarboxylase family protein [Actinobacteria bacterium]|nr:carboxymuconolactone decarboxylase family protein [Actinomycetota bacterium]
MDNLEKEKIKQIIENRNKSHSYFSKKSKVYRSFVEMEKNTYSDGKLSKKQKELIAIGISIVINCESCMEWHIKQAINDGAKEDEILEAIEVGIEMTGGPGTASARFAMNVLDYYLNDK